MPRWMRRFLKSKSLWQHLWISLGVALVLRGLSAYFVYGPQALDDYKHGVWPAYQLFSGQPLDLPEYRSHLLIWLLSGFIKVGAWFGATSAIAQVRVMYMGLGILSLSGIFGTYLFVQTFRSKLFSALALYLVAAFPLMPFISTRAFGEAVATSLVLLSFGLLERARRLEINKNYSSWSLWVLGFLVLGWAALFRFHVGLLYLAYIGVLLQQKKWRAVGLGFLVGCMTIFEQYLVDHLSDKIPFGTLLAYLAENQGGATKYGVSPWYNTWAFVLAVAFVPFSLVLIKKIPALWRQHWTWLIPFLIFVLAHSLVPHKEERFIYPVVGLELWALARLWASGAYERMARKIFSRAFLVLSLPILLVVCFVNTQEGEIEPPAYVESRYKDVVYLDYDSLFGVSRYQFYFLRPPSTLQKIERQDFNINKVDTTLVENPHAQAVVLISSDPSVGDELHALEGIKSLEGHCLSTRAAGSVIDQLIYRLNPKHNERRRPTWYLICERG